MMKIQPHQIISPPTEEDEWVITFDKEKKEWTFQKKNGESVNLTEIEIALLIEIKRKLDSIDTQILDNQSKQIDDFLKTI